ncbi:mas-related G-protein coupled receptor member D-like [Rhineura floridana]|uniref:mas-related G-protein coupled receptor member D-like n=1 Tax=Rhineura floridana TaxID=261503 RepID=UPI002AC7F3F8|nr:mas-related G-protein coupled receptor member D-like [Rhineura floridana]
MASNNTYSECGEEYYGLDELIIRSVAILICMFGLVGNGYVFWLLGFTIKRNPFTTYILNLAAADFSVAMFLSLRLILVLADSFGGLSYQAHILQIQLKYFCRFSYTASLCFRTIISMERCLSAFFPSWHQLRRPKCLSSRLAFLVWTLSAMFYGMLISFHLHYNMTLFPVSRILFIVNIWGLPPILALFTLVLLAKICWNSRQRRPPGRLTSAIVLFLLFFLVCRGPWIIAFSYCICSDQFFYTFLAISHLLHSVDSSIKPMFYYLVGKQDQCSSTEPLKAILWRVFQDEDYSTQEDELMGAAHLMT